MKRYWPSILLVAGLIGLLGFFAFRGVQERNLYRAELGRRTEAIREGLEKDWARFLLDKLRSGELKVAHRVFFNRSGTHLFGSFFPDQPVELDWKSFRDLKTNGREVEVRLFLEKALKKAGSWDRILALEAWQRRYGERLPVQSEYERSVSDPVVRAAFRRIFSIESKVDAIEMANTEWNFSGVFYRVDPTSMNGLEVGIPGQVKVTETFLPEFVRLKNLRSVSLADDILRFRVIDSNFSTPLLGWETILWLGVVAILIISGLLGFYRVAREHQKDVIRKVSFLNQVVHELKTPLTGLKLHLQLMQRGDRSEEGMRRLEACVDRLDRLFDDVVLMNRTDQDVRLISMTEDDWKDVISGLKNEFGDHLQVEGVPLKGILGDPSRIRLILRNLVKNGIRYGKKVTLVWIENGVLVRDEGPGVSLEDSKQIFGEFFRAKNAKGLNPDGLGLGLSIVQKLASEVRGEVSLINPGCPGAEFRLRFFGRG